MAIGYSSGDPDGAANYLISRIDNLKRQLGVPGSLREQGIEESVFQAELPDFINKFNGNPNLPPLISNPEKCTTENMRELFKATYFGA